MNDTGKVEFGVTGTWRQSTKLNHITVENERRDNVRFTTVIATYKVLATQEGVKLEPLS